MASDDRKIKTNPAPKNDTLPKKGHCDFQIRPVASATGQHLREHLSGRIFHD
jgi:hypothetical protein